MTIQITELAERLYACRECGHARIATTNHRLDIYPTCQGHCRQYIRTGRGASEQEHVLPKQTAHRFIQDL